MEIDAVVGNVGMALVDEVLRDANHVIDVFRASRVNIGPKDVQSVHVLIVSIDVLLHESLPVPIKLVGTMDDFVINVGEVLDIVDIVAAGFKPPMNQVKSEVATGVSEVTAIVHGHAAHVHGHLPRFKRGEVHLLSPTRVVQTNGHGLQSGLVCDALEGSYETRRSGRTWQPMFPCESS